MKIEAKPGSRTASLRLMRAVRRTGEVFELIEEQGNPTVCGLGFMMGDRTPRVKPEGFAYGLFGLFFARRLAGEELYNGAAVFASREQAEIRRTRLLGEGWTVYIATWEAREPFEEITRVR